MEEANGVLKGLAARIEHTPLNPPLETGEGRDGSRELRSQITRRSPDAQRA
jgi:hypothetical protein